MPLTLNPGQLWGKVKKQVGKSFYLIKSKRPLTIGEVVNHGVNIEDVRKKSGWLGRDHITECYEFVRKNGKYTSKDYKSRRIKVPGNLLPRIIALLAFVVPEEIESFTQDEGEVCYGARLRGIRTVHKTGIERRGNSFG